MAGVRRFEDLDAWKLATQVEDAVYDLTRAGPVLADRRFREQIRDAGSSAPSNIAEGWGRVKPNDFANFLRIARASLNETKNHLRKGRRLNYFSQDDFDRLHILTCRAIGATSALRRYLLSCGGKLPWEDD